MLNNKKSINVFYYEKLQFVGGHLLINNIDIWQLFTVALKCGVLYDFIFYIRQDLSLESNKTLFIELGQNKFIGLNKRDKRTTWKKCL